MGGSPDVSPDFRHMVPSAEVPAHQQSGTAGGSPHTSALPPPGHQQGRDSDDGQHHSRGQIKNQGGTHLQSLYRQTVLLLEWADSKRITLVPRHIPGHLNVVAD